MEGDDGHARREQTVPAVDHLRRRGERLGRAAAGEADSREVVEDEDVGVEPVGVQAIVGVGVVNALDNHARKRRQQRGERRLVEAVATRHDERSRGRRRAARAARGRAVGNHRRMLAHALGLASPARR